MRASRRENRTEDLLLKHPHLRADLIQQGGADEEPGVWHSAAAVARRESAVVDLAGVGFIASLGMGLLVSTAKALHRFGKRLVLLRPQSLVEDALEAAGLHEILPIAKDDGAVERLLCA